MSQDNLPKDPKINDPFDAQLDDEFFQELDALANTTKTEHLSDFTANGFSADDLGLNDDLGLTKTNHTNSTSTASDPFALDIDKLEQQTQTAVQADLTEQTSTQESSLDDDLSFLDSQDTANTKGFDFGDLEQTNPEDAQLSQAINAIEPEDKAPEIVAAAVPAKKSLFSKFGKDKNAPKETKKDSLGLEKPAKTAKKISKKSSDSTAGKAEAKKPHLLILASLVGLLALIGIWFLTQNKASEPVPAPTAVTTEPAPAPAPEAVAPEPEVIETETTTPTDAPVDGTARTELLTETPEMIDTDAIVNAEIPSDDALIKEEIDRLKDKDGRLSEQAKLIDEQLAEIQELTSAKEEQIALLEKQIALLEEQKSASQ